MISAKMAAISYALLTAGVMLFQLGLALGMPWGQLAMGGAYNGSFPPTLRIAALVQMILLGLLALIVLMRANLVMPQKSMLARRLIWFVVPINLLSLVLNLITPSAPERLLWGPVTLLLVLCSLRVALRD